MKKLFVKLMAVAIAACTFTACEDVPEPYNNPYDSMKEQVPLVEVEPAGTGTAADPYNVTALIAACEGLGAGEYINNGNEVYVKGIVVETTEVSAQYGNATYYIADDLNGLLRFYVFRGKLLDGASVTSDSDLKVGDKVTVCGKVFNYQDKSGNLTLEFAQGNYLVALNSASGNGGNTEKPTTDAKIVSVADFLAAAESTDTWYQLTGTISNLKDGDKYGNFDLTDETGSVYVYGLLSEKGGEKQKFQELVAEHNLKNGSTITIIGNRSSYNEKPQVKNAYFVKAGSGETPAPSGEAKGDGTQSNPYNVAALIAACNGLAAGEYINGGNEVYVSGIVAEIVELSAQYGNATYYIADGLNASDRFYVFRGKLLDGASVTSESDLKVGDKVTVCGKVFNYQDKSGNTTLEFAQGNYLVALNGGNTPAPSGDAKGDGTQSNPYNVAALIAACNGLAAGEYINGGNEVYVSGIVVEIVELSAQYGNATYYIADDLNASDRFYVFRGKLLDGASVTSESDLKVGDKVTVCGKVFNYQDKSGNTTLEFAQGNYLVSLDGSNAGGNDNPSSGGNGFGTLNGNVLTLVAADCGFENASELSTVTLTDGTKLVFAQGDGTNGPKYYTAGASFRLYAKNSVSIQAGTKTIQKVVVTLPSADKKGNEQMTPKPSIDGTTATFNNVNKSTLDIVNDYTDVKAGTQFHIAAIEITYAN